MLTVVAGFILGASAYKCVLPDNSIVFQAEPCKTGAQKEMIKPETQPAVNQATGTQSRSVRFWYQDGSLHRSSGRDWVAASYSNRLASAGDFAAAILKGKFSSMDELRVYAVEMETCISETLKAPGSLSMKASEIGAACAVLMGWGDK